ncbi:MAG: lysine--tRNA ligase [Bdellovibrionaceae bacterium]|nr:lysine--tRNA ligase [Pseudobdellovibrionaceae bacterium]
MSDSLDNPLRTEKRRKSRELKTQGINAFPYKFERIGNCSQISKDFSGLQSGEKKPENVFKIAGRLMTLRNMGKAAFFNLQDQSGSLQIYLKIEELLPEERAAFDLIDLGDIVGVEGFPFRTQKGELSLHAKHFQILTKTIEPLPEKFHGIQDVEIKYRHRHLDLLSDPQSRRVFEVRSQIIREIRTYLDGAGFLEVETPVLQPIYGGAAAHPFSTHHRALDMKLFMKISPELYLKRLIVGGFEKVYEIGKNFRNEGIDRSHNPEFTMLEWYEAYTDYNDQITRFETLTAQLAKSVTGSMKVTYQGKEIDFTPPWRRLTVFDGIREYAKIDPEAILDGDLFNEIRRRGSKKLKPGSRGEMLMELFELTVEEHLWQPTFVMDHPMEISPLTKVHRKDSRLVERFEPFAACMEIGNAYSELNDPEEQRRRLKEQEEKRIVDEEAHPMDEDFLHAIETGLPPTGGVGFGVERIVMILTDRPSIRDIILFPTMKFNK